MSLVCPYCKTADSSFKKGFYLRHSDSLLIQKYRCKACKKTYSEQHFGIDFRLRLRDSNQNIFMTLCSGVSQRRCAALFKTRPRTIARRLNRFGGICQDNLRIYRECREKVSVVQFDEMESSEHTKCKPLTIPIAVEQQTRKILALKVGEIAAKGKLSKKSIQKYGRRSCQRNVCLSSILQDLKVCTRENALIKTDQSQHYPAVIKKFFPAASHKAIKGSRGCSTGYGELKRTGFDPIFTLNHTFAMIRDNIKRLARRTWCTTKLKEKLELFIYMYAWFHNMWVDRKIIPVKLIKLNGNVARSS